MNDDRKMTWLLVAAGGFLVLTGGLYLWAMQPPEPVAIAAASPAPTPAPTTAPTRKRKPPKPLRKPTPPPFVPASRPSDPDPDDEPRQFEEVVTMTINGLVLDASGGPVPGALIHVIEAGRTRKARANADGEFTVRRKGAEVRLMAERRDGALATRSPVVTVDGTGGGDFDVDLHLPAERGGLGISLAPHADGIKVRRVRPDSPAAEIGLEAGDVIFEVDGEEVGGMNSRVISEMIMGEIGTDVELGVRSADGSEDIVTFTRQRIGK